MIDILHQLLKGHVMHTITWIGQTLKSVIGANWRTRLDARFRAVPPFPTLKIFTNFSNVKQWTGDKQKALVR